MSLIEFRTVKEGDTYVPAKHPHVTGASEDLYMKVEGKSVTQYRTKMTKRISPQREIVTDQWTEWMDFPDGSSLGGSMP